MARPPTTCIARRSIGCAGPSSARSSLERICSTVSGCAAGADASTREQLRTAHGMFAAIGMDAFADRARRELMATGEKVRTRSAETRDQLTPQEEQIARLARDGLSNPEIGSQLFLSARTVEWHLRKVFTKLGIRSRRQLRTALSEGGVSFASA
jgi:DNA-binding NarL/FixJ family response regulator